MEIFTDYREENALTAEELDQVSGGTYEVGAEVILYCPGCKKETCHYTFSGNRAMCEKCGNVLYGV